MRDIILLVSLVAVSLAFEECGRRGTDRRPRSSDEVGKRQAIYGPLGQMAREGEFPWQVLIKTRMGLQKYACGGTLIAKNWVLTTARCFSEEQVNFPSSTKVMVGIWRQYTFPPGTEQEIPIMKIIRHEDFIPRTMQNDIALIQLAKNADCSSEYVGPACLPNLGDDYHNSGNCWGTGWGEWLKPAPFTKYPDELQKVIGSIPDNSFLKASWGNKIFDGMIGFPAPPIQGEKSGFCFGDIGGPLVCPSKSKRHHEYLKWDVVGIMSWGHKNCKDKISVLTSVTHHLPWINNKMNLALPECGLKGAGLTDRRLRSLDQVGKRQTIYGPLKEVAARGEFPWMVQLIATSTKQGFCGGTLIAKEWVLTAAHCVKDVRRKDFLVRVGTRCQHTPDDTEKEIHVEMVIPHREYGGSLSNGGTGEKDIALVKLAEDADCSSRYVGTACLPNPEDDYEGSTDCWVTGWGVSLDSLEPTKLCPNELQKLKGSILRDAELKTKWGHARIFPGMIGFMTPSDKGEYSGVHFKDSGGPLVCLSKSKASNSFQGLHGKYDVVGIVSWHDPLDPTRPDVFTSVTYFLPWIEDNMK